MKTNEVFQIFGYLASLNACLMMFPQLYFTVKKKSFEDLSVKMICLNLLTQALFLPYSTHFNLYPLIIVNTMLASCDVIILVYYVVYRKNNEIEDSNGLAKDLLYNVFQDSSEP